MKKQLKKAIRIPLYFIGLMWLSHVLQVLQGVRWIGLGIYPRHLEGSLGILTAPFIHGSFGHLFSNSIPLFFLIAVLYLAYRKSASAALASIYIGTGVGMWLFARSSYHIGASGVVYGLVAFLFWTGVFRKSIRSIALSLAVLFLYSGYIWGIFPGEAGISWDGHLIGAIVGIIVAFILRNRLEEREKETKYSYMEEEESQQYFFERDVFDDSE
jgi:membrane associated rhomboid family serine protease